jgi:soluble lytic murein transglycosylase-like protein
MPAGFVAALFALAAPAAQAQIFAGRTPGGAVVLSNFRGPDTPTAVVPREGGARDDAIARAGTRNDAKAERFSALLNDVAHEEDLPVDLLHAVIAVESAYDAAAVSAKGAQGLMQLMPATARRFGVLDPLDPRENVRGGARYLKWLLERFGGDLQLALAGYNAGEDAVVRAGYRVPPYAETQRYVPRVLSRLQSGARI